MSVRAAEVIIAPVEYAVAVDRYLVAAELGLASRRVYRISRASWAWPLVGLLPPDGRSRRKAVPPIVPLSVLDQDDAGRKLAGAIAYRTAHAEVRTVNREVSALRSAIRWWQGRQWIAADPMAALSPAAGQRPAAVAPLTQAQVAALFRRPAGLREQAFWHLLRDSGAPADAVLALDASVMDFSSRRARAPGGNPIEWGAKTGELLGWLLAGRRHGPVFLTDRRAPADTSPADACPLSGRGRMSYRRAAEIFTEHTRQLAPDGRGWTLHQLRRGAAS